MRPAPFYCIASLLQSTTTQSHHHLVPHTTIMAIPNTAALDFEALLSREYRPALVTRLIPREKYHPDEHKKKKNAAPKPPPLAADDAAARRQAEETSRLVLSLVAQTQAFKRHPLQESERPGIHKNLLTAPPPTRFSVDDIESAFHEIELGDWESKILWDGGRAAAGTEDHVKPPKSDPLALLERPRNHFLDNLKFDNTTVSWEGDAKDLLEKARKAPLILELGVAGQSVARHVYQNTVLSAQRPVPALKSAAYRNRVERDWSQNITSTADVGKGSLHANKDQEAKIIEARQKKRAQMAEDKTTRVAEAMGTMAVGGGRGRTVTSSLMGPGGNYLAFY
jgi:hypothetical protein